MGSRNNGFPNPRATQTSDLSRSSTTLKPLIVACSTGTLPETAVMPATSSSADLRASMSARASSIPPSISIMTREGLLDPGPFLESFRDFLGGQRVGKIPEFQILKTSPILQLCEGVHRVLSDNCLVAPEEGVSSCVPDATVGMETRDN